jgi:hypothetical protein
MKNNKDFTEIIDCGTYVETRLTNVSKDLLSKMPFPHNRKNSFGWVEGLVPSTNGSLFWVKHKDRTIATYLQEEIIIH